MATEYIKRQAALNIVCSDDCPDCPDGGCDKYRRIKRLPAANVRPVVMGKWIDGKCDKCGEHAPYWCMASTYHTTNFCPNCGADMREVTADG